MSEHPTQPLTAGPGPAHDGVHEDDPQGSWAAGRHPVNVGQLVMGLAFLGLAAIWALIAGDVLDSDALSWLLPVPWLVAGAAGLLATTLGSARRRGRS